MRKDENRPMELSGEYRFDLPRRVVWDALQQPGDFAGAIPSCREFTELGPGEYALKVRVGIGMLRGTASGRFRMHDQVDTSAFQLSGKGGGGPVRARGAGVVRLDEAGATTLLRYSATIDVRSKLPFIRSQAVAAVGRTMIQQVLKSVDRQIQDQYAKDRAARKARKAALGPS